MTVVRVALPLVTPRSESRTGPLARICYHFQPNLFSTFNVAHYEERCRVDVCMSLEFGLGCGLEGSDEEVTARPVLFVTQGIAFFGAGFDGCRSGRREDQ